MSARVSTPGTKLWPSCWYPPIRMRGTFDPLGAARVPGRGGHSIVSGGAAEPVAAVLTSRDSPSRSDSWRSRASNRTETSPRDDRDARGARVKITEVRATTCDVPLPRPIIMGDIRYDSREYVVVEIVTRQRRDRHRVRDDPQQPGRRDRPAIPRAAASRRGPGPDRASLGPALLRKSPDRRAGHLHARAECSRCRAVGPEGPGGRDADLAPAWWRPDDRPRRGRRRVPGLGPDGCRPRARARRLRRARLPAGQGGGRRDARRHAAAEGRPAGARAGRRSRLRRPLGVARPPRAWSRPSARGPTSTSASSRTRSRPS